MFAEALAYALTPAPAWARRAGLLHQSVALAARYRRCRKAWDEHYAHCQAWVERAAAEAEPGGVVVFGSGPGHDLPLARLLARFQHVLLVDAIHPWRVRWQDWCHLGLECLTYDLSGWLNPAAVDFELPPDTRAVVAVASHSNNPSWRVVGVGRARRGLRLPCLVYTWRLARRASSPQ